MTLRTLPLLLLAVLASCSPESTAPLPEEGGNEVRAIHIARNGVPVDSVIRAGAFGPMSLQLLAELRDGTLRPLADQRVVWGSTQPSVLDVQSEGDGTAHFARQQNGRARIIAAVGPLRDSVMLEIRQVASAIVLNADTLVTLTPNAKDLGGAPTAYHTFRFGAYRVDSSGILVASRERIDYGIVGDTIFDIFPETRGDTVSIAGRRAGSGQIEVRIGEMVDTVPVQVAASYRVIRFSLTAAGHPRAIAPTITIPAGAAIVFRNETQFVLQFGDAWGPDRSWLVGPIPPGGRQAQRFDTPGTFDFFWAGERSSIIVTP